MHPNITLKIGDITKEKVCAIVNAANSSLMGGGGVDGAIHRAGGTQILEACRVIRKTTYPNGLPTGEAIATTAGHMDAQYVIHTVGPIYAQCGAHCETQLASCYINALKTAFALQCRSIAFPAISTGIYGYPKAEAARVAYQSVTAFLEEGHKIDVHFIFHSVQDKELFSENINIVDPS